MSKSIQQSILDFFVKHIRWIIVVFFLICILISINMYYDIKTTNINKIFTDNIVNITKSIDKKDYHQANKILSNIDIIQLSQNQKYIYYLLSLRVKSQLKKDILSLKKEIKELKYICQYREFDQFSLAGELLLDYAIVFHFLDQEYDECISKIKMKGMQFVGHSISYKYVSEALMRTNKAEARKFLFNIVVTQQNLNQIDRTILESLLLQS